MNCLIFVICICTLLALSKTVWSQLPLVQPSSYLQSVAHHDRFSGSSDGTDRLVRIDLRIFEHVNGGCAMSRSGQAIGLSPWKNRRNEWLCYKSKLSKSRMRESSWFFQVLKMVSFFDVLVPNKSENGQSFSTFDVLEDPGIRVILEPTPLYKSFVIIDYSDRAASGAYSFEDFKAPPWFFCEYEQFCAHTKFIRRLIACRLFCCQSCGRSSCGYFPGGCV